MAEEQRTTMASDKLYEGNEVTCAKVAESLDLIA